MLLPEGIRPQGVASITTSLYGRVQTIMVEEYPCNGRQGLRVSDYLAPSSSVERPNAASANTVGASADANSMGRDPRSRRWVGVAGVDLVIAGVRVKGLDVPLDNGLDVRLNLLALDGLASRRCCLKPRSAAFDGALLLMV